MATGKPSTGESIRTRTPIVSTQFVIAIGLSLIHFGLMVSLYSGDFFNSYPYISDDGFDWITQGVAFNQFVTGQDTSAWPVLRSPVFVLVAALDDAVGFPGAVFVLAQSAAVGATAYMIGQFARAKGIGPLIVASLMLASYFFIFGFYRLWVLSDTIAAAFMTGSVVLLLRALQEPAEASAIVWMQRLGPAVVVTALAGLTQTYGLIPFLVICGVYSLAALFGRRRFIAALPPAMAAVAATVLVLSGQVLWTAMIPHHSQPTQFGLIKLSLGMADFYVHVWTISFGVLIPAIAASSFSKFRRHVWPSVEELALVLAAAAFAGLSFVYQWPESRMTFMYMPVVWLALAAWCGRPAGSAPGRVERWATLFSATATALIGLLVVPGDFWRPNLSAARIDPVASWVAVALRSGPLDRYHLQTQCAGMADVCERAVFEPQPSPYREAMFNEYRRRKVQQKK